MDLSAPGRVSVWIGTFGDLEEYREHVAFAYDEDGDEAASEFTRACGLDWYDEDLAEGLVAPSGLAERLDGVSWAESFVPAVRADLAQLRAQGWRPNTAHLIYDLDAAVIGPRAAPLVLLGVYDFAR